MLRDNTRLFSSINIVFVLIISVLLVLFFWQIRSILMLMLAATLLTVLVTVPVRFFMARGLSRGLSIILSVIGGFFLVALLSLLMLPTLFTQFTVLFQEIIPQGIQQLIDRWNSGALLEQLPFLEETLQTIEIDSNLVNQILNQITSALGLLGGSVVPLLGGVASAVLSLLIILFLCVYLVAEPDRYIDGLIQLTPRWYRTRMREILVRLDDTVRAWLRVTGASMLIAGIGTAVGLALLGIQQWAALGVLTGLLSFIPNFGPVIALIPSIAVAIIQTPENLFWVIVVIYGVSFIQSQVVGPVLANENMSLAPVLVLVGQIVFGIFFGFLGIMLAVPMTAMASVIIDEVYVKDILGDRTPSYVPEDPLHVDIELQPQTD